MTIRAALSGIFGAGASQDINYLRLQTNPNWSAEGVLTGLLNNLIQPVEAILHAENGGDLQAENGESLQIVLINPTIEAELWEIALLADSRISKVFIGINEPV